LSAGPITFPNDSPPAVMGSTLASQTFTIVLPSPAADVNARATSNDNSRLPAALRSGTSFTLNNNADVSIPAGNYYFQRISIQNSARLRVTGGTATFYLTGGGVFNGATNSGTLRIISSGSEEISFNGFSQVNIDLLYAPNAVVRMTGDQTLVGSVAAREIHLSESGRLQTTNDVLSDFLMCPPAPPMGGTTTGGGTTTTSGGDDGSESDPTMTEFPDLPDLPS